MEKWCEENKAPDQIMGSKLHSGQIRPLCPSPNYPECNGSWDIRGGANWKSIEP
jgi:hypothetical protein